MASLVSPPESTSQVRPLVRIPLGRYQFGSCLLDSVVDGACDQLAQDNRAAERINVGCRREN
jgi:hypothetical protein